MCLSLSPAGSGLPGSGQFSRSCPAELMPSPHPAPSPQLLMVLGAERRTHFLNNLSFLPGQCGLSPCVSISLEEGGEGHFRGPSRFRMMDGQRLSGRPGSPYGELK